MEVDFVHNNANPSDERRRTNKTVETNLPGSMEPLQAPTIEPVAHSSAQNNQERAATQDSEAVKTAVTATQPTAQRTLTQVLQVVTP